jgi:RNA polymerase sigma-70 factor (ECF subfamily)
VYQRRAVSLAYRLVGHLEDAREISQEAFIRAFRSLHQLSDPARFGGWLMRVVGNLSLNHRRSRKARRAAPLASESDGSEGSDLPDRKAWVGGALTEELRAAINTALEKLPDRQRLALILFSVEGLPQKEVAEILECSVELVKWNVFQARQKLKDLLAEFL